MQNDSFKMCQHYAPYNRSEESHDLSEKYILRTFSVGYFAFAQYDDLSPIVGVADTSPTRRTRPFCCYRDISPVSAGEFTPKEEAEKLCLCERSEANSREGRGLQSIFSVLFRWDISHSLNMTKKKKEVIPLNQIALVGGDFFMQKIGVMLILYNYIKKYI